MQKVLHSAAAGCCGRTSVGVATHQSLLLVGIVITTPSLSISTNANVRHRHPFRRRLSATACDEDGTDPLSCHNQVNQRRHYHPYRQQQPTFFPHVHTGADCVVCYPQRDTTSSSSSLSSEKKVEEKTMTTSPTTTTTTPTRSSGGHLLADSSRASGIQEKEEEASLAHHHHPQLAVEEKKNAEEEEATTEVGELLKVIQLIEDEGKDPALAKELRSILEKELRSSSYTTTPHQQQQRVVVVPPPSSPSSASSSSLSKGQLGTTVPPLPLPPPSNFSWLEDPEGKRVTSTAKKAAALEEFLSLQIRNKDNIGSNMTTSVSAEQQQQQQQAQEEVREREMSQLLNSVMRTLPNPPPPLSPTAATSEEESRNISGKDCEELAKFMCDTYIADESPVSSSTTAAAPPIKEDDYKKDVDAEKIVRKEEIEKQSKFYRTLCDFDNLVTTGTTTTASSSSSSSSTDSSKTCDEEEDEEVRQKKLNYFLCCGTALGVIREHRFIPHDEDIDIGVFYEDLVAFGRAREGGGGDFTKMARVLSDSEAAQLGVLHLISLLSLSPPPHHHQSRSSSPATSVGSSSGSFLCFDILGQVDFGLEMRFKHSVTGVLLDLNIYYEGLDDENDDESSSSSSSIDDRHHSLRKSSRKEDEDKDRRYVWFATHLEDCGKRRHGMYRYKHTPFRDQLQKVCFIPKCLLSSSEEDSSQCHAATTASSSFWMPPISPYLIEYFGSDWQTPKKYNYQEALSSGEYKNLIPE